MFRFAILLLVAGLVRAGPVLSLARFGGEDVSGSGQAGEAGLELSRPLAVQITSSGRPVPGVSVRFEVLSEPAENRSPAQRAALGDTLVRTDEHGVARVRLRLGANPGEYRVLARTENQELVLAATALRRGWYFVSIIELAGGLALFLFGLYYGSKGLRRLAGDRLRQAVFSLTANRWLGALVGVVITAVFQSSSATTVLLIGLASAGILGLGQSLAVVLGADIGTTITVQILAFRFFDYALVVAVIGFILMNSHRRLKNLGQAIFGFGLVFFSLKIVFAAVEPVRAVPEIALSIVRLGHVPWLGLLVAVVLTALVRSSAATIGIVVGLAFTGLVDIATAIPFILGANIGSSFAALIAAWRGPVEARRIAVGHLLFKVIIVAICLPFLPWLTRLVLLTARDTARQVANAHTLINLFALIVFLPLLGPYQRLLQLLVPESGRRKFGPRYLDPGALEAPELAIAQATREVLRMADRVVLMYNRSIEVFLNRDKEGRRELVALDDQVDRLEEGLIGFLARISQEELSDRLSHKTVALFHITDELEHIADIVSKSLMAHAAKRIEHGLAFSEEGLDEIRSFHAEVGENVRAAVACVATWDAGIARRLVAAKDRGVERKRDLHNRHLERVRRGQKESLDTSTVHLDFISDLERINYHCSQVGAAVLGFVGRTRLGVLGQTGS
ncbi:MAG: Na/Pi symporter [candidate division WOR-3 bacterium]